MTCLYDPLSPEQLRDPYPAWAAHPAVFYDERLGMWSVTGYDEVLAVLRDTATFSSADAFALRGFPRPRMLVAKDPPEHTRLRKLMQRAFTPRRVAELEPFVEATCHELAGHLRSDLMAEYANALPAGDHAHPRLRGRRGPGAATVGPRTSSCSRPPRAQRTAATPSAWRGCGRRWSARAS